MLTKVNKGDVKMTYKQCFDLEALESVTSKQYIETLNETMKFFGNRIVKFFTHKECTEIILTDNTDRLFYIVKFSNFKNDKPRITVNRINLSSVLDIVDYVGSDV